MEIRYPFFLFLFISSSCLGRFVLDGHVQIRDCGNEDRDDNGQLYPLAIDNPLVWFSDCDGCEITFIFDVPKAGGKPIIHKIQSKGLSKERELLLKNDFESNWIFPYCKHDRENTGFVNEKRVFKGR